MWIADRWDEYALLDASQGEKLEAFGAYRLVRPDPQVLWKSERSDPGWKHPDAYYHRSAKGGGSWEFFGLPETWDIHYQLDMGSLMTFRLKPFKFKHTGVFPEQAVNWEWSYRLIRERIFDRGGPVRVLNLFAYTGGATMAAALAGAEVTHVDASRGMVSWAKENAAASGLADAPIRYITDDAIKFVKREIRRGRRYDAVIMDPPSYGRGPDGELWKIEDCLYDLVKLCSELLTDDALFFLINSYTTGLQAGVLAYMLELLIASSFHGHVEAGELGLPVGDGRLILPEGAAGRFTGSI